MLVCWFEDSTEKYSEGGLQTGMMALPVCTKSCVIIMTLWNVVPTLLYKSRKCGLRESEVFNACACLLSCFSRVRLFAILWTVTCQAPLSTGFSRQECWSALPCPPPGHFPNPGIEPASLASLALRADSLLLKHQGSPKCSIPEAKNSRDRTQTKNI